MPLTYSEPTTIVNDNSAMKIIKMLDDEDIERYEVTSIITRNDTDITTIIVNTGFLEIAFEIDNKLGIVIHQEKLSR